MNAHEFVFTERLLLLLLAYKTQQGARKVSSNVNAINFLLLNALGEEKEKREKGKREK